MARSNLSDVLQVFPFWLFDVAPNEGRSLPIFNPLAGFATCSAPGLTFEMQDITEGNWHFRRKVIKKVDVDSITVPRGVTFSDSDFCKWTFAAVTCNPQGFQVRRHFDKLSIGGPTPRRNFLLIQFFARNPLAALNTLSGLAGAQIGAQIGIESSLGFGGTSFPFGPFEFSPKIPAKAWMLHDCIPVRYKTGSDFDASSGDVSIAEIEFQPEMFEEINLAG